MAGLQSEIKDKRNVQPLPSVSETNVGSGGVFGLTRGITPPSLPQGTGGMFNAIPQRQGSPRFEFWNENFCVREYEWEFRGEARSLPPASSHSLALWSLLGDEPVSERVSTLFSERTTGRQTITETIAPEAENYARSIGISGALVIAKTVVKETMGSVISSMHIDRMEDPEENIYGTLRLVVTLRTSVDHALELDDLLQNRLMERIPAIERIHISITYNFE